MYKELKRFILEVIRKLVSLFSSNINKQIEEGKGGGLIDIGEKETDWVLGSSFDLAKRIDESEGWNHHIEYEYNQGAEYETRNWCTIFSAVTEVSYLMRYHFSITEIKEIGHKMIEDGKLDPNMGAYLSDAIDYVRRWWNNKFPHNKIESYRIDYTDRDITNSLNLKNKMTQLGYRTSKELYRDCQNDGVASKSNYPKVGGHAVSKQRLVIIDNYKSQLKYNRYTFPKLKELINNGVVYRNGYVFLKAK